MKFQNKIFMVIPTINMGGAERVASQLSNLWANEKHDVHLVLLAKSEDFYKINEKVKIHRLGFENKGLISKLFSEIRTFFKMRKLLKNERPDFVLSFMTKYNIFTIIAASFLNIPVFVSDRANLLTKRSLVERLLKKITYKKAKGILAQTHDAKKILGKIGNHSIKVVPNPINSKSIQNDFGRKEKVIINVGRMVPEKGHIYLLEAFSKINAPDWKLVILGDGPLRNELEQLSKKLSIENRVEMPGSVKNVDEWLKRASIFAFSSISEGFPNALAEAMAAGLPCISFDCDAGPRDIIKHNQNGILVPVGSVELMCEELEFLTKQRSERERLGENAKKIINELNINKIAGEILDFIGKSME